LLQVVTIARDASIDTKISASPLTIPVAALFYGIGRFVQTRVSKGSPSSPAAAA
jgi:hypothetical protein